MNGLNQCSVRRSIRQRLIVMMYLNINSASINLSVPPHHYRRDKIIREIWFSCYARAPYLVPPPRGKGNTINRTTHVTHISRDGPAVIVGPLIRASVSARDRRSVYDTRGECCVVFVVVSKRTVCARVCVRRREKNRASSRSNRVADTAFVFVSRDTPIANSYVSFHVRVSRVHGFLRGRQGECDVYWPFKTSVYAPSSSPYELKVANVSFRFPPRTTRRLATVVANTKSDEW